MTATTKQKKYGYYLLFFIELIIGLLVIICGCLMLNYRLEWKLEHILLSVLVIEMGMRWFLDNRFRG